MDDEYVGIGQLQIRIQAADATVIPSVDRSQKNVCEQVGSKSQRSANTMEVVGDRNCIQYSGYMYDVDASLVPGFFQLLVCPGSVRRGEVYCAFCQLADSGPASFGLIVHCYLRMQGVVLGEPFGIERIGKRCSSTVQGYRF